MASDTSVAPAADGTATLDFRALTRALLALDPYHGALEPLVDDLARIAELNDQLRGAYQRVATRSGFEAGQAVHREHLAEDATAIHAYFEYVHFASPAFLKTVGEWPVGGARG